MKTERKMALGRRQFLRAAASAAAASVALPLATEALADTETNEEKRKARYKETDHIKAYYRVNRYPASK